MPARLHRADIVSDIFGDGAIPRCLAASGEGRGALVYLRDGAAGVPANLFGAEATGSDGARAMLWREIGLGDQSRAIRRELDPAAHRQSAHRRRPVGLRHRDRGGRADRRVGDARGPELPERVEGGRGGGGGGGRGGGGGGFRLISAHVPSAR